MALGSTQPLTEMSTRNLPVGKARPARKADLTTICEPIVQKMWEPRPLTPLFLKQFRSLRRDAHCTNRSAGMDFHLRKAKNKKQSLHSCL
jgi:hypothetical protein